MNLDRNRKLIGLGALLILSIFGFWITHENDDDQIPPPIRSIPRTDGLSSEGGNSGSFGAQSESADSSVAEFPPFVRNSEFYRINPVLVDQAKGPALNISLLDDLGIPDDQRASLVNSLMPLVIRLNSKAAVEVNDGIPALSPMRAQKIAYKIHPKDVQSIDEAAKEVRDSFVAVLGESKGAELFRRASLAAEGDPYLRGFGKNSLVIYVSRDSPAQLRNFRWEYEVLTNDGTVVGSGMRNTPRGIPRAFNELFHAEELSAESESADH